MLAVVIPAQAGIYGFQYTLDPGVRRGDENYTFYGSIILDKSLNIVLHKFIYKTDAMSDKQ
jgi:hypothetical protein